jgi:hypothetical protein
MDRDMVEFHATVDKCCEILQRTNDGDDLDPADLKLTELAVNGRLNERGMKALDELHSRVVAGAYTKPWLHGVEPMTRDNEGYIYYKDKHVEHYSRHYVNSLQAKRDLTELRNQCEWLERRGIELSSVNAVCGWVKFAPEYSADRRAELDSALAGRGFTFSKVVIDNNWNDEIEFFTPGAPDWEEVRNGAEFKDFYDRTDREHGFEVSIQSYRYGGFRETGSTEALGLIPSCFGRLNTGNLLVKIKSQVFKIEPERENESEPDDEAEWGDDD